MRKQGFMKRVLGGVMSVAFGAALCFATPLKAEALEDYYPAPTYNYGEIIAAGAKDYADFYAGLAKGNMNAIQHGARQELGWTAYYAQTDAANKMTQSLLGSVYQNYRNPAIFNAMVAVDRSLTAEMRHAKDQADAWNVFQQEQADAMKYHLAGSQTYAQLSAVGAQVGQLYRAMDNLLGTSNARLGAMAATTLPYADTLGDVEIAGRVVTGAVNGFVPAPLNTYGFYYR